MALSLHTAEVLDCFRCALAGLRKPAHHAVAARIDALFAHVKAHTASACVVGTVEELRTIECRTCRTYALLHIKAHDLELVAAACRQIRARARGGAQVKAVFSAHLRGCRHRASCSVCGHLRAAMRSEGAIRKHHLKEAFHSKHGL